MPVRLPRLGGHSRAPAQACSVLGGLIRFLWAEAVHAPGGVGAAFTGRDSLLEHLREALASGQRVAVQALHGCRGVGKTQLALEYAYRFAGEYKVAWWITSEDPTLIPDQLAQLAARTGIGSAGTALAAAVELLLAELGGTGPDGTLEGLSMTPKSRRGQAVQDERVPVAARATAVRGGTAWPGCWSTG